MKTTKVPTLNPSSLSPRTKKVAAKKAVQSVAASYAAKEFGKVLAKRTAQVGVKALSKTATRTAAKVALNTTVKVGTKVVAKSFARGLSNPWLLAADGVDFGARKVCENMDMDEDTARAVGKGSGLVASIGIGAAVGGPIGAGAGAVLWVIGEGVSCLFGWND